MRCFFIGSVVHTLQLQKHAFTVAFLDDHYRRHSAPASARKLRKLNAQNVSAQTSPTADLAWSVRAIQVGDFQ